MAVAWFWQWFQSVRSTFLPDWAGRLGRSIALIFCLLFLTGCVRDEMTLRFDDANHGQWTQRIRLEQQVMTGVGRPLAIAYLNTLEERAKQLGGRTKHLSEREFSIQIPFFNAADLQTKFNAFFSGELPNSRSSRSSQKLADLAGIQSHLQIWTNNWIVSQRYHLIYDLDLRSLQSLFPDPTRSTRPPAGNTAIDPKTLLSLDLILMTPEAAQIPTDVVSLAPTPRQHASQQKGRQLTWHLKPGEVNHLEATFWVSSAIGRGFVAIVLLVVGGAIVKILRTPAIAFVEDLNQKSPKRL